VEGSWCGGVLREVGFRGRGGEGEVRAKGVVDAWGGGGAESGFGVLGVGGGWHYAEGLWR